MTPSALSRTRNARGRVGEVRVGVITSQDDVIAIIRQYVVDHSTKHDLSSASWTEVWNAKFGGPDVNVNAGGISSFLKDADACAGLLCGINPRCDACDETAGKFMDSFNSKLGKAGDNGWVTLPEMLTFLDVKDEPAQADTPFLLAPGVVPKSGPTIMLAPGILPPKTGPTTPIPTTPANRTTSIPLGGGDRSATAPASSSEKSGIGMIVLGAAAIGTLAILASR